MNTQYTFKEIAKFSDFCMRHDMRFNTMREYVAAINQYFTKD